MTLKTRRLLFYSLAFLFLLAAAGVIFYSMGLRIDFDNRVLTRTGGIYIVSEPTGIRITLNGELVEDDTGIFRQGTLIDNLPPDNYVITVGKDGYHMWQKNTAVESGVVSIFDFVILVPNGAATRIGDGADAFYLQGNRFVTETSGAIFFNGEQLAGDAIVRVTEGGNVVSFDSDEETYFLSNVSNPQNTLDINATFNRLKEVQLGLPGAVPIVKIEPYPFDEERFIVMTGRALYSLNTGTLSVEQIDESARNFVIRGNQVFWINEEGVSGFHLVFRTRTTLLSASSLDFDEVTGLDLDRTGRNIALTTERGALILYNADTGATTTLSENSSAFAFSPETDAIAFAEYESTLRAYQFGRTQEKPETLTLTTLSGVSVERIEWYGDGIHFFALDTGGNLRFLEIDDELPINNVLVNSGVRAFAYGRNEGLLYFATASGLWSLEL